MIAEEEKRLEARINTQNSLAHFSVLFCKHHENCQDWPFLLLFAVNPEL